MATQAATYQYLEEAALMALADDVMNPKSTTVEIKKLTIHERVQLARAILELNDMLRDREKP